MKKINQYESEVTGKIYVGTTTITGVIAKPELYYWYGKNGTKKCGEILKDSQEFGSKVHAIVQNHIGGQELELDSKEKRILKNFLSKADKEVKEWLWFEKDFANDEFEYGGTADGCYLDKKGKKVLMDIKTGGNVYPEHYLQMAAYEYGLKAENFDEKRIWHLDKETGGWEILEAKTNGLFDVFKHVREVYRWKAGK